MRPLPFRIGASNQGTRLAKPEAQLSEQILALADSQMDSEALLNPSAERLAIPKIGTELLLSRRLP